MGAEGSVQRAIIPQRAALPPGEAPPHGIALSAQIGVDGGGIAGLIGEAHREATRRLVRDAGDVGLFARSPVGLGFSVTVSAIGDERCDIFAEQSTDRYELGQTALILDRIVQQRGNRLIFVCPLLERDRGDGEAVGDIGVLLPLRVWGRCSWLAEASASLKRAARKGAIGAPVIAGSSGFQIKRQLRPAAKLRA